MVDIGAAKRLMPLFSRLRDIACQTPGGSGNRPPRLKSLRSAQHAGRMFPSFISEKNHESEP